MSFTFVNSSSADISIAEYTTSGGYVPDGTIGPGQSRGGSTYTGYVWQVNNSGGGCLNEFNVFGSGSVSVVS